MIAFLPAVFLSAGVPPARYLLLAAVAFGAGALNAVAGGGSFFSFPTLLSLRIPPVNANATNSVALWPGQITALIAFRRELYSIRGLLLPVIICSAIGGIVGGVALLYTSQKTFMRMVPWLLLVATVMFAVGDPARRYFERRRTTSRAETGAETHDETRDHLSPALLVSLTIVSVYIGYFGAGAAFLVYALFATFGGIAQLHRIVAVKNLCNAVGNGIAVATFIVARAVYWKEALVMLVLASAGGYFGAAYSRALSPRALRIFVTVTGLAFSAYYFWRQ